MIPAAGAGAVTVIVPVATAQVGCVGVTAGAAGVAGCGSIVTEVTAEIQPVAFLTVTLYVPRATVVNAPVVLVYVVPSIL